MTEWLGFQSDKLWASWVVYSNLKLGAYMCNEENTAESLGEFVRERVKLLTI
jgi:hypothetical protein